MKIFILFFLVLSCKPSGQFGSDLRTIATASEKKSLDEISLSLEDQNQNSELTKSTTTTSSTNTTSSNNTTTATSNESTSISTNSYTTYYLDRDGDGYGDKENSTEDTSQPSGYVSNNLDCDDTDGEVYPDADEVCGDIKDKNCDDVILTVLYPDADGDGYGDSNGTTLTASSTTCQYEEYSLLDGDCDDSNALLTPETKWYEDYDNDGAGDSSGTAIYTQCENPSTSGISFSLNQLDCDDEDPTMYDSDTGCIVEGDENDTNYTTYYYDSDGDNYGDPNYSKRALSEPSEYVDNDDDCDDSNSEINPEATEECGETTDKNCDGFISTLLYPDLDEDGYGDPNGTAIDATTTNCLLSKYSSIATDCNDLDSSINPETNWYEDYDGDGYGKSSGAIIYTQCEEPSSSIVAFVSNKNDCDDDDAYTYPNEEGNCTTIAASDIKTYYYDNDGDGYGDPNTTKEAVDQPTGYVVGGSDCDDQDDTSYPGADETCGDTVDKNCDGFIPDTLYPDLDEDGYGDPDGETLEANSTNCLLGKYSLSPTDCDDSNEDVNPETKWYEDYDGDGYGKDSGNVIYTQCEEPSSSASNLVANNDDCDDNSESVYPGAPAGCLIDADCDGIKETSHCEIVATNAISVTNSSSIEGSTVSASCEENWIMTGCTCYEPHEGCGGGSYMEKSSDGTITCNAKNKNNNAVTVTAQCIHLGNPSDTSLFMTNYATEIVISAASGTENNDTTTASCQNDYTMTGCSCNSTGSSCGDGAYMDGNNSCLARADGTGFSVYAIATCLKLSGEHTIVQARKTGSESAATDDATSTTSCSSGYFAVGCSCYNSYQGCHDGAIFDGNGTTCTAYRDSSSSSTAAGVMAKVNCLKID